MARPPAEHRLVAAAYALDQHLLAAPDAGLVPGQGTPVDHGLEPVETLGHDVGGHEVVLHGRGAGAGPRREDERVRAVVTGVGAYGERLLEVVLGLAGEPDDDVGGHSEVVHGGPGVRQALEVTPRGVAAPHGAQHAVAPRLQRQVQLLAHLRRGGHRLYGLGPQVLGVRTGEADAPDALDRPDGAQQIGEQRAALGEIAAVGVHVLPEQRHLGHPGAGQLRHLGHDLVPGAAHLGAAHGRHDAEGARVVAPGLDVHPRRVRQLPHGPGAELVVSRTLGCGRVEDLQHRAFVTGAPQEAGSAGQVVRPEDDVHPPHLLLNQLAILLSETPAHRDLQPRLAVDELLQPAQGAVEAPVRVLADTARVEDDHVGVLLGGCRFQAVGHEQPGQALGIVLVHLAPEGANEIGPGHAPESTERGAYHSAA